MRRRRGVKEGSICRHASTDKIISLKRLRNLKYKPILKAEKDRDTVSVEPGSKPFFVSESLTKSQFLGIESAKDTFSLY